MAWSPLARSSAWYTEDPQCARTEHCRRQELPPLNNSSELTCLLNEVLNLPTSSTSLQKVSSLTTTITITTTRTLSEKAQARLTIDSSVSHTLLIRSHFLLFSFICFTQTPSFSRTFTLLSIYINIFESFSRLLPEQNAHLHKSQFHLTSQPTQLHLPSQSTPSPLPHFTTLYELRTFNPSSFKHTLSVD